MIDSPIPLYLSEMVNKYPKMKGGYTYQGAGNDRLYQHHYLRNIGNKTNSCDRCDPSQLISREHRDRTEPEIYYGNIASSNHPIKDGMARERLREEYNAICFPVPLKMSRKWFRMRALL